MSATNVPSGSNGDETDGGETAGGQTEGGSETGSTASEPTTGGPAPTREACDRYLDCLAVVSPAELPTAQMGFGPDGTCWDGPPESIEQCIQACVSGWEALHDLAPEEPACYLCVEDGDCAAGEACVDGDCRLPNCGDGIVDDNEACDGQVDCAPDCRGEGCNPVSHAGCEGDDLCYLVGASMECLPPEDGLPGLHEPCVSTGMQDCAAGFMCAPALGKVDCDPEVSNYCCTPLCNADAEPDSCPGATSCVIEFLIKPPQRDYVGLCLLM